MRLHLIRSSCDMNFLDFDLVVVMALLIEVME